MAGPDLQRARQAVEQPSGLADRHIGMAELAVRRPRQRAAQDLRHELHAVADAEHRHAQLEQRVVAVRRAGLVDAHRPAREDDAGRLPAGDLGGRRAEREDLGVDVQLAEPPRDELGVLRSEVEDQDDLMRHGGGGCGGGVHRCWVCGPASGPARRSGYYIEVPPVERTRSGGRCASLHRLLVVTGRLVAHRAALVALVCGAGVRRRRAAGAPPPAASGRAAQGGAGAAGAARSAALPLLSAPAGVDATTSARRPPRRRRPTASASTCPSSTGDHRRLRPGHRRRSVRAALSDQAGAGRGRRPRSS